MLPFESVRVNHTKGLGWFVSHPRAHLAFGQRAPRVKGAECGQRPGPGSEHTIHHLLTMLQRAGGSLLKVVLGGKGSLGTGWDSAPCASAVISEGLTRHWGNRGLKGPVSLLSLPFPNLQDTLQLIKLSPLSPSPLSPVLVPHGPHTVLTLYTASQRPDSSNK